MKLCRTFSLAGLLLLTSPKAWAQDGVYGRLEGDLSLSAEAGVATITPFAATAQVRALYLATVGAYGTVQAPTSDWSPVSFSAGVELRPLFLGRFLNGMEQGPAALDLALDAIFLGMGARFEGSRSAAFELGTGIEIPLLGRFDGFYLGGRLYQVFSRERMEGLGNGDTQLLLTLGYRGVLAAHLADWRDQLVR